MNTVNNAPAKAKIQTEQLLQNIYSFKKKINKETAFMAVVKANAYSHGALPLAQAMEEAEAVDYFGVAQLQEALELREAQIETPILIFNAIPIDEIDRAIQKDLTLTVFSKEMAQAIRTRAQILHTKATVHLKIDTGMGRLGVSNFEDALALYRLLDSHYVDIEGIYTHFADADQLGSENFTHTQFAHFQKVLDRFMVYRIEFGLIHACNTAATLNYPAYHLDMVRVGIGLYGFNPTAQEEMQLALTPIQQLDATVTQVKEFPAGESIGYNRTYFSKEAMRIATVAIGYADGVPLALSNKGYFTYQGKQLPIVGKVCMDQIMLDASAAPNLVVNESVNYFGDPQESYTSLADLAAQANSTVYELLCRIGNRVQRVYSNS